ncbi:MAG: GTP cyclohydrolase I FolE [Gammaproteobacteria bacterium]|jgi:GTP cyclohydrolase I|nr:GTP cyclohydrolase I FolE [Gammaproteobacteria bacterium]
MLALLGEDEQREGLRRTPGRAAEALRFLTRGYGTRLEDVVNGALFETDLDEMVVVRGVEFYSLCEHHLLPFFGYCHVGYLPRGRVLGLSKVARLVDVFARRLQVQEQMTVQIARAVSEVTGALGVGVVVEARHLCMMMRGVEKQHSSTTTSSMLGEFRLNAATRAEFLSSVGRS